MVVLNKKIEELLFEFIKEKYYEYLENKNIAYIQFDKIDETVTEIYCENEYNAKKYIRENLKDFLIDEYNSPLVENIIFEIFDDKDMNMTRISTEIDNYQKTKLNKNYDTIEVSLIPDEKEGLGLKLNFKDYVFVNSFKKSSIGKILPAQDSNLIQLNDIISKINNNNLENITVNSMINIVKNEIKKEKINMLIKREIC